MKNKYRAFDQSTNLIITTYGPYKGYKFEQDKIGSFKKIQPMNVKIFDRQKKHQKILSRNDRLDLFLEGGHVVQAKKEQTRSNHSFYKMSRIKKKSQLFVSLRNDNKANGWKGNFQAEQAHKEFAINLNQQNLYIKTHQRKSLSNINHKIKVQKTDKESTQLISQEKQKSADIKSNDNHRKPQSLKISAKIGNEKLMKNKSASSAENNQLVGIQKIERGEKMKKPLFYLEPKEVSHIKSDSYIVMEYPSGQIIFGNYFKRAAEIASLTKIMTFYAVIEIAKNYEKNIEEQIIEIDEEAQGISGTSADIFVGDSYTVQQLLYGLMLPSGNDAAIALAKWGGRIIEQANSDKNYVKTFVQYMNSLAKNLNMKSTKFLNPHGLPHPQSGSTPEDIAILVSKCLGCPFFRTVVKTKQYKCWVEHKGIRHEVIWENTNKLLRRSNFIGVKTGVTVTAGPCLATCYEAGDKIFIIILLRTNKLSRRFKETRFILALALLKLDKKRYRDKIKQILKVDADLDSDNSEDQQEFNYERSDAKQIAKRNKILTFQM